MEIFKWANDIEKVYVDLIKNTKEASIAEINALMNNQEKMVEFSLNQKQKIVNLALKNLAEELRLEVIKLKDNLTKALKDIEEQYNKNESSLIEDILKKIKLEF